MIRNLLWQVSLCPLCGDTAVSMVSYLSEEITIDQYLVSNKYHNKGYFSEGI